MVGFTLVEGQTPCRQATAPCTFLRPFTSAVLLTAYEPTTVPINAVTTVNPGQASSSPKYPCRAPVVPEMMAVSKPNKSPPNAATIVKPSTFFLLVAIGFSCCSRAFVHSGVL